VGFTIGAIEFYCNGVRITDKFEENLAFYFMLNGRWAVSEPEARIENNDLIYFEFIAAPEEPVPNQQFQMLAYLSEMISQNYDHLTASDIGIESLSPTVEPDALGILIPQEYRGKHLPLWRFTLTTQ
jgi:hypothetical protein